MFGFFEKKRIFLDYASSTPVLKEVWDAMERYLALDFYNPSAIYAEGARLKKHLEIYRTRIARSLGATTKGVIFTSGGTESDNLAIIGAFEKALESIKKPHIIISAIEHPAVFAAAKEVERRGGEMSILPVNEHGLVSPEDLKGLLKKNTFLVSVGLANNEIGTVQPISRLGRIVREKRRESVSEYPYLHTDASQAVSFLDLDLENLQADMLSLDGAKVYGPKGVGVLAVRRGVKLLPMIHGGSQEGGLRAGTPSLALIAGLSKALEIAGRDREKESKRLESYRKYFSEYVSRQIKNASINGAPGSRLPNIVSVSVPGVLSEFLLIKLDSAGVMASVGSACSYDERESGSPVIKAIGKPELSESTIRFSFGRFTAQNEVKKAAEIFCRMAQSVVK